MRLQKYVLITAGGIGARMQSPTPKQYLELAGRPVLLHVFDKFLAYDPAIHFVLVLPETTLDQWHALCQQHGFTHEHQLAYSGPARFHSVKNGLKFIPEDCLVAIHDGARPLVSIETISRVFKHAAAFGNAIPTTTIHDSVRLLVNPTSKPFPRNQLRVVQTPQCFLASEIKEAYQVNYQESFTDDASVLEATGKRIFLVEGNEDNLKLTTPNHLKFAEALLTSGRQ